MANLTRKAMIAFAICIVIAGALLWTMYPFQYNRKILPTYFNYTNAELKSLSKSNSDQQITVEELKKWDQIMFGLVKKNKLGDAYASRVYAYIYVAQRDAAFLSKNIKHASMGSVEPVSAKVLCLFFLGDCEELKIQSNADVYSNLLADILVDKIKQRMQLDKQNTRSYPAKDPHHYWAGTLPYFGQDTGSWKTWFVQSGSQFRALPPPGYNSSEWQNQLKITQTALANITSMQTKVVVFWAGNPGTITPPGQWLVFANDYMWSQNLPLDKALLIRSVLAMGIADSVIAIFDSKYTYWIKRPFMLDSNLKTVMPTPNFPAYPAGHSGISAAAATILSYYFPEEQKRWWENADEASAGRVWGGIHFPIDVEAGVTLGKNVGNAVLKKQ